MPFKNILLIEDDEDDQEIFLSALEIANQHVQCVTLNSAAEALNLLINKQLQPDLIFLDLNMPVMNGQQFLVEIKHKEQLKDIPVIILSTSSYKATIAHTRELGAMDFFSKPEHFEDLVVLLQSVLVQ